MRKMGTWDCQSPLPPYNPLEQSKTHTTNLLEEQNSLKLNNSLLPYPNTKPPSPDCSCSNYDLIKKIKLKKIMWTGIVLNMSGLVSLL